MVTYFDFQASTSPTRTALASFCQHWPPCFAFMRSLGLTRHGLGCFMFMSSFGTIEKIIGTSSEFRHALEPVWLLFFQAGRHWGQPKGEGRAALSCLKIHRVSVRVHGM